MPKKFDNGLSFGPEEGVNLDQPPVFLEGYLVPTYGAYGGPGYTAGEYLPAPGTADYSVLPIDPLDALFQTHDKAYETAFSGLDPSLSMAEADVALIEGISHIPSGQLDAEAAIYGGLATLLTIAQVELGDYPELLSDVQDVHYALGALHDIQRGLGDLDAEQFAVAAPFVDLALNTFSQIFTSGFDLI